MHRDLRDAGKGKFRYRGTKGAHLSTRPVCTKIIRQTGSGKESAGWEKRSGERLDTIEMWPRTPGGSNAESNDEASDTTRVVVRIGRSSRACITTRGGTAVAQKPSASTQITITPAAAQNVITGAPDRFTGSVRVRSLFDPKDQARSSGGQVTFQPGARSAWHTHPLGQVLIVTDGVGWIQQWGGPIQMMRKGDVVWIPAGVKHWHGATPTTSMTHIAFQESLNGAAVNWLEQVTDDQYRPTK